MWAGFSNHEEANPRMKIELSAQELNWIFGGLRLVQRGLTERNIIEPIREILCDYPDGDGNPTDMPTVDDIEKLLIEMNSDRRDR
jgi:hypothetical protein